jgi:hypothetical protein
MTVFDYAGPSTRQNLVQKKPLWGLVGLGKIIALLNIRSSHPDRSSSEMWLFYLSPSDRAKEKYR